MKYKSSLQWQRAFCAGTVSVLVCSTITYLRSCFGSRHGIIDRRSVGMSEFVNLLQIRRLSLLGRGRGIIAAFVFVNDIHAVTAGRFAVIDV